MYSMYFYIVHSAYVFQYNPYTCSKFVISRLCTSMSLQMQSYQALHSCIFKRKIRKELIISPSKLSHHILLCQYSTFYILFCIVASYSCLFPLRVSKTASLYVHPSQHASIQHSNLHIANIQQLSINRKSIWKALPT